MRRRTPLCSVLSFAMLIGLALLSPVAVQGEDIVWLQGTFQEVNSASPVTGSATMPLSLARSIVRSTPQKYLDDVKTGGFDLEAILAALEAMPMDQVFQIKRDDYHLVIHKYSAAAPEAKPSLLFIRSDSLSIPVPLAITGTAITLLQFAIKDLKGLDQQLATLLEEVKKTPPGLLLKGEDRLMQSWLEIRLQ